MSDHRNEIPIEDALFNVAETMARIWPSEISRPHIRTFWQWKKEGKIPFVKLNRSIYFNPARVLEAIQAFSGS